MKSFTLKNGKTIQVDTIREDSQYIHIQVNVDGNENFEKELKESFTTLNEWVAFNFDVISI